MVLKWKNTEVYKKAVDLKRYLKISHSLKHPLSSLSSSHTLAWLGGDCISNIRDIRKYIFEMSGGAVDVQLCLLERSSAVQKSIHMIVGPNRRVWGKSHFEKVTVPWRCDAESWSNITLSYFQKRCLIIKTNFLSQIGVEKKDLEVWKNKCISFICRVHLEVYSCAVHPLQSFEIMSR